MVPGLPRAPAQGCRAAPLLPALSFPAPRFLAVLLMGHLPPLTSVAITVTIISECSVCLPGQLCSPALTRSSGQVILPGSGHSQHDLQTPCPNRVG